MICKAAHPIEIFGDKGSVKDNRIWSHIFPGQRGWIEVPTILPDTSGVTHHPFQGQVDPFADRILEDAIHTHEVIFAAQRCYGTGKPERLPLG